MKTNHINRIKKLIKIIKMGLRNAGKDIIITVDTISKNQNIKIFITIPYQSITNPH